MFRCFLTTHVGGVRTFQQARSFLCYLGRFSPDRIWCLRERMGGLEDKSVVAETEEEYNDESPDLYVWVILDLL